MRLLICNRLATKLNALISVLLGIAFTLSYAPQPVWANEAVHFSVGAVLSDKQVNRDVSYFDLRLEPGEEHVLEVNIFNNGDTTLNASVTACTAGTNSSGVIEYDNIDVTDDSLKVSFADVSTVEESMISVPPAAKGSARIRIKMPETVFDGIMLGGIVITKVELPDAGSGTGGTSILNEYRYVIAAKIAVSETPEEPEFRLRSVEPTLSNYRTGIAANLQNYHAAIAKDIKIDANVYRNNEPEPLYSNSSVDFDVAPNSNFDYIIPCSGKLPAGDYRLTLTIEHENRLWEFEESFSITAAVANEINDRTVDVPGINYYFVATICLSLLLIILLLIIIIWMKKSKKKD